MGNASKLVWLDGHMVIVRHDNAGNIVCLDGYMVIVRHDEMHVWPYVNDGKIISHGHDIRKSEIVATTNDTSVNR